MAFPLELHFRERPNVKGHDVGGSQGGPDAKPVEARSSILGGCDFEGGRLLLAARYRGGGIDTRPGRQFPFPACR